MRSPRISRPRLGSALNPSWTAIPRRLTTSRLRRTDIGFPGTSQTSQPSWTVGAMAPASSIEPTLCDAIPHGAGVLSPYIKRLPHCTAGCRRIHRVNCATPSRFVTTDTLGGRRRIKTPDEDCGTLVATMTFTSFQGYQVRREAAGFNDGAGSDGRGRFIDPVAAVDDGGRLIALAGGEALLFAAAGPPQDRAEEFAGGDRDQAELPFHLPAQGPNFNRHRRIRRVQAMLHGPEGTDPGLAQS